MQRPESQSDDDWRDLLERQVRDNSGLFFKLAYGVLRDRVAAEDACQQALLSAWKSRQELAKPEALTAWLCRSVVNGSLAQLRRRRLEHKAARELAEQAVDRVAPDNSLERHELLMAALAEVPEPARTAVVLRVMEGLSGREVAEMVGCSPAEVSRRLHRGLDHLRRYLARRHLLVAELP